MATTPAPRSTPGPQAPTRHAVDPALYTARVENTCGTSGRVLIHDASAVELGVVDSDHASRPEGGPHPEGAVALPTGGPVAGAEGFNPEQFLAMAWSTCLGETLRVVMAAQGLEHPSQVSVEVGLHRDPAGGYRFAPRALVSIEGIAPDRAQQLVDAAHARCPVSKLLRGQGEPMVELIVQH
ncbi:OsmC family protein [Brachybacterium paraconglomeratum]|uniref:OsmC family protein n=1 Tax=Brachybacterium paraconglomeratum TaxID=173362 RepID=UPI0031EF89BB